MKWGLFSKIVDLFIKRSKNAERDQDIKKDTVTVTTKVLAGLAILFGLGCALNELFPALQISPWWYSTFEKIIDYFIQLNPA